MLVLTENESIYCGAVRGTCIIIPVNFVASINIEKVALQKKEDL